MHKLIRGWVLFLAVSACVYNPPSEQKTQSATTTVAIPVGQAWDRVLAVLTESGYTITATSKESGSITTGEKLVRLNETQADCGNIWGIPYTKDPRTQTLVSFTVRLTESSLGQTKTVIATRVEGRFLAYAGAQTTLLQCQSLGYLEQDLIGKLGNK